MSLDLTEVNLMVRVNVNPNALDDVVELMRKLQKATNLEPGCEHYQFYRDRSSLKCSTYKSVIATEKLFILMRILRIC